MNNISAGVATTLTRRLCCGVLAAVVTSWAGASDAPTAPAVSAPPTASEPVSRTPAPSPSLPGSRYADFNGVSRSDEARQLADWVIDSNNHRGLPFVIVDKKHATVFVFHRNGRLRGSAPVLLGVAIGDDSAAGVGLKKLSAILPHERTTPAGRFVATLDHNVHGVEILWVDYDAAISLHRVITTVRKDQRAQRLASPTPLDNRISYGCINVPAAFFDGIIGPAFKGTNGIVYILPETRSANGVFGSPPVSE